MAGLIVSNSSCPGAFHTSLIPPMLMSLTSSAISFTSLHPSVAIFVFCPIQFTMLVLRTILFSFTMDRNSFIATSINPFYYLHFPVPTFQKPQPIPNSPSRNRRFILKNRVFLPTRTILILISSL